MRIPDQHDGVHQTEVLQGPIAPKPQSPNPQPAALNRIFGSAATGPPSPTLLILPRSAAAWCTTSAAHSDSARVISSRSGAGRSAPRAKEPTQARSHWREARARPNHHCHGTDRARRRRQGAQCGAKLLEDSNLFELACGTSKPKEYNLDTEDASVFSNESAKDVSVFPHAADQTG
jgi:hypothetical protein